MQNMWEYTYKLQSSHPWLMGKLFHNFLSFVLTVAICFLNRTNIISLHIDYDGFTKYVITVASVMSAFCLSNIFTISNPNEKSVLSSLSNRQRKALFSHNSSAIGCSFLLIIFYLFIGNVVTNYIFIFLTFCTLFAMFRIYLLMYLFARADLNTEI